MGSWGRRIGSVAIVALGFLGWLRFEANTAQANPANLLTNGSFTTDLTGWTLSSQTFGGCINYEPPHVTIWPFLGFQPLDGNAVWLNACGASTNRPLISQTLAATEGAAHEISGFVHTGFYLSGNSSNLFDNFDVLVDGISLTLVFGTPDINGWTPFSTTFVASSSSIVVGFMGEKAGDIDYVVDSLSIIQTASPTTTTAAATTSAPALIVPAHSVSLDMNGGECLFDGTTARGELTTVFLGYRYLPGHDECQRIGFSFHAWALRHSTQSAGLPLLIDPHDGVRRYFVAHTLELVALWSPHSESETASPTPAAPETTSPSTVERRVPTPSPAVLPITGRTEGPDWLWAMAFLSLGALLTVVSRRYMAISGAGSRPMR